MRGFLREVRKLWRNTGLKFGGKLQKIRRLGGSKKNYFHKVRLIICLDINYFK
jgi:hypothetical protein